MLDTVIFDMDGLMFDTETLAFKIFKQLIEAENLVFDPNFVYSIRGRSAEAAKELFTKKFYPNTSVNYEELRTKKNQLLQKYLAENPIPLKNGLLALLEYLRLKQFKMVVASSTKKELVLKYLKKANIISYFTNIIGGDEVKETKPNPEIFLRAVKSVDSSPENALVLEDSLAGVKAAINGKLKVVWIPDDIEIEEARNLATITLASLEEVISFLENNN